MLDVLLDPILPVFAILAFGFVMGRRGAVSGEEARQINRFAMTVLLPLLLFDLVSHAPIHEFRLAPVAVYLVSEAVIFAIGFWLAFRVLGHPPAESSLLAFCGVFANNAFYVLPIALLLYGQDGVLPITTVITLDALVAFAAVTIAVQVFTQGRAAPRDVARRIAGNPILISMVAGLVFALARWPVPDPVETFLNFNGAAAAPVALFAMGVVLSQTRIGVDATVASFTAIKLIAFPLTVWLGLSLFGGGQPDEATFLLAAAGPSGAMGFSLALLYGVRTESIAQIIVWTGVLTLFTLAILA